MKDSVEQYIKYLVSDRPPDGGAPPGDPRDERGANRLLVFRGVTLRQVWSVWCSRCKAGAGERCRPMGGYVTGTHDERIASARSKFAHKRPPFAHRGQIGQ